MLGVLGSTIANDYKDHYIALQPYGRGLDQRTSAIWPGFGTERFSHMAGVFEFFVRELLPFGMSLDQRSLCLLA